VRKLFQYLLIATLCIILISSMSIIGCKKTETTTSTATETTMSKETTTTTETTVSQTTSAQQEVKKFHMIFVPKLVHPWYDAVEKGIKDAIENYKKDGYEITYDWNAPQSADIALHVQTIEAAISKNPDILAVSSLDPDSDTPVINEAVDKGIKVMTFDCDAPQSKRIMFVGHTPEADEKSGVKVADFMVEKMGTDNAEIALLSGSPTAPNHVARVKGFKEAIAAKYPNLKIVAEEFDNDDLEKAVTLTEAILSAHPNIKGIYCVNASNPVGAANAIKAAGKAGKIVIVGLADLPELMSYLKEGVITGTLYYGVYAHGYQTVKYAIDIMNGKKVPAVFDIPDLIVTKDNLDAYNKAATSPDGSW
jgi:ribose transport system substrate-binding protein